MSTSIQSSDPLVEFRGVSYTVNGGAPIIDRLSLAVSQGETLVLLGESGCGKTTTLRLVNRLLMPTAGKVWVEGKPTTKWDAIRLRRRTGYVIQEAGLFPHFTVAQNVAVVPSLEGWDEARIQKRVRELLQLGWTRKSLLSAIPVSSPADNVSAWASRARWPPTRRCF